MSNEELLKYAISNGMINMDEVSKKIHMNLIDKVNEVHPYKITPPSDIAKNKRWQTYVKDESKKSGRRLIAARDEDEIYQMLANIYGISEDVDVLTLNVLFDKWLPYKSKLTNSPNTIYRHRSHWRRYCKHDSFCDIDIHEYTTVALEEWANALIKKYNMTRKEWQNIKTVISGMFKYAVKRDWLTSNPWEGIEIKVKYKQVSKRDPFTQVFIGSEFDKIINSCLTLYNATSNEAYAAVYINFFCGMREGELVALKVRDINLFQRHIHVQRELVHNRIIREDGSCYYEWKIEEHTKTYSSRYIPILEQPYNLLENIISKRMSKGINNHENSFLFMKDDTPLTTRQIDHALMYACKKAGVANKTSHKIRKTFASKLNAGGVPLDEIRDLLGHVDSQTTIGYLFNPLPKDETLNIIQNSF